MKKILLLTPLILLLSCTESNENLPNQQELPETVSIHRSYSEALKIAQNSILLLDGNSKTRSISETRKIDLEKTKIIKANPTTRSLMQNNDTLIYVFNFENNKGFALVSASNKTEGLLAVTEEGHFIPNEKSQIDGLNMFIEKAKTYVSKSIIPPIEPIDTMISIRAVDVDVDSIVGPYVSVKWGQDEPEGIFFNNKIAGCTNIAMAQIMSYFNYPSNIHLSYNNSGYLALNWPAMKSHHDKSHTVRQCNDEATHNMIGKLCRELGHLNKSQAREKSTETITGTVAIPTLNKLGFNTKDWKSYNTSYVKNQLNEHHLIMMTGQLHNSNEGHTWVIDGYRVIGKRLYTYKKIGKGPWFVDEVIDQTSYYNHINWGFYGMNNGYFAENVFDMTEITYRDTTYNPYNYNFDWNLRVLSVYR